MKLEGSPVEQFIKEVDSYIRRYNEKRIKLSPGSRSPINIDKVSGSRNKPVNVLSAPPRVEAGGIQQP